MAFTEYDHYDAMGLAELVRQRHITPQELLDTAIERVEARHGSISAVGTNRVTSPSSFGLRPSSNRHSPGPTAGPNTEENHDASWHL